MEMQTLTIVALVVDTSQLTIYLQNGTKMYIPQGDTRLRGILEQATPQLVAHGVATVTIAEKESSPFKAFEKKSNGLVRFFSVAKEKLSKFFADTVEPQVIGEPGKSQIAQPKEEASLSEKGVEEARMTAAYEEILENAVPTSDPLFGVGVKTQGKMADSLTEEAKKSTLGEEPNTVIAVVDNKIVPHMELIASQFANAASSDHSIGMTRFTQRLAAMTVKRNHSVQDLLKFLERGDLPIADDGSIVIYKVLRTYGKDDNGKAIYVDCHTRKVQQRVGSRVCMDESLVDHDRRNECSNGLHVARRAYVGTFSGDVCVLAKVNPEDVIAVPNYDANKMRVCAYTILAELSNEQYKRLCNNKDITNTDEGKTLLGNVLAGNHGVADQIVRITRDQGHGVMVENLKDEELPSNSEVVIEQVAKLAEVLTDGTEKLDKPVNVTDVLETVKVVEQATGASRREQVAKLVKRFAATKVATEKAAIAAEITRLKKESKKGWHNVGLSDKDGDKYASYNK